MSRLTEILVAGLTVALALSPVLAAHAQQTKAHQTKAQENVTVTIDAPQHTQSIVFEGEPRLSQLTERLRWQDVYWPGARLCSQTVQNKLEARRAAAVAQLQLLQGVYQQQQDDTLSNATQALIEQVKQWPLLGGYSNSTQQGLQPALIPTTLQRNWALLAKHQPYQLSVGEAPQSVHWVGLTQEPGEYAYAQQPLAKWLGERQQAQQVDSTDTWEVTINGNINRVDEYSTQRPPLQLQPGAILYSGFPAAQLPQGFADVNKRLLELLQYWDHNGGSQQEGLPCS